jgi:hypothetical protein
MGSKMLEQIRVGMAALDQNLKYNGAFGGGARLFAENRFLTIRGLP